MRNTLVFVMLQMIALEGDGSRQSDDDVAKYTEKAIGHRSRMTKGEVVTDFVDSERHGLIDSPTEHVGGQNDQRPRKRCRGISGGDLKNRKSGRRYSPNVIQSCCR